MSLHNTCNVPKSWTLNEHLLNYLYFSIIYNYITLLSLLYFSAAFNTVSHTFLLQRLHHSFGISDIVLLWLESYLTGRTRTMVLLCYPRQWYIVEFYKDQCWVQFSFFCTVQASSIRLRSTDLAYTYVQMIYKSMGTACRHDVISADRFRQTCQSILKPSGTGWRSSNRLWLNPSRLKLSG
jgi:hypothetical protein